MRVMSDHRIPVRDCQSFRRLGPRKFSPAAGALLSLSSLAFHRGSGGALRRRRGAEPTYLIRWTRGFALRVPFIVCTDKEDCTLTSDSVSISPWLVYLLYWVLRMRNDHWPDGLKFRLPHYAIGTWGLLESGKSPRTCNESPSNRRQNAAPRIGNARLAGVLLPSNVKIRRGRAALCAGQYRGC